MRARNWVLVLLLVPFVAVLYPPLYAALTPKLLGIPFFIWYQFAAAIVSAVLTIVVYLVETAGDGSDASREPAAARKEA